jgi:hypothetical protein
MSDIKRKIDDMSQAAAAMPWIQQNIINGLKSGPVVVSLGREVRSNDANNKFWALMTDIANQVQWFGKMRTKEEWKVIVTGSFFQCEFIPNIENTGFVIVAPSSIQDPATFSQIIEYVYAFGAEKDVKWSDPSLAVFEQYREHKA